MAGCFLCKHGEETDSKVIENNNNNNNEFDLNSAFHKPKGAFVWVSILAEFWTCWSLSVVLYVPQAVNKRHWWKRSKRFSADVELGVISVAVEEESMFPDDHPKR